MFEIEQWPQSVIQEYKALNIVSPFTNDAKNQTEGLLIQLIRNQNVTEKKYFRSANQLLPYLNEFPEYLEHPTVKKLNSLISSMHSEEQMANLMMKVKEEIELELNKDEPDDYLIARLSQLYFKHTAA
ncbi:hypothetical protein KGV31_002171 [Vibrio parahaemolyticus]|nr:hypothetical protein [Vibrio parahaemolyticus]EHU0344314.1 hypothetical protein [Vibrio parahaemolyticus]EHU0354348.1 hypothetical protein [Vibrio parahaemolyticus]